MPSIFNVFSAALLTALLLCASGAPVEDSSTDSPAGDPSGEDGEETSDLLSTWKAFADIAKQHKKEFEDEFQKGVIFLDNYRAASFPTKCPESNISKEACFKKLAEGLIVYNVLLKHVESAYPNNSVLSAGKLYSKPLIQQIKEKMRHGDWVKALTSSQEEQLLKELDKPGDDYHRRMTAHSILHHLSKFLADGKRAIFKRERADRNTESIFYHVLKL